MCLAVPALVTEIDSEQRSATVSLAGISKLISIELVPDVTVGDYVLIHVGYALSKIDKEEAKKTLALFDEAGLLTAENMQ